MSEIKRVIFIPPNGKMFINDFSIQRLGEYFKNKHNIHTTLLRIGDLRPMETFENIDDVITVASQDELFDKLKSLKYDVIFHRSWMLAYPFAATLVKEFDNVIVNIKDWNFSTKKEYKIMFGKKAADDFKAIDYIFKNTKAILSHYTHNQAKIWAKKYNVDESKFIFFPEYCNEKNFNNRKNITYQNPKIVLAASLAPASYPEEMFPTKSNFRALKEITKSSIDVSYVLAQGTYRGTQSPKQRLLFQDVLYEDKFNPFFHLKEGRTLDASVLNDYHFGFFILEYSTKSKYLNQYAIPSKFAFYLEAGLPILANSSMKALSHYIRSYGIGIVFDNKDINNFSKVLDISPQDYKQMVENIINFRKNYILNQERINQLFLD